MRARRRVIATALVAGLTAAAGVMRPAAQDQRFRAGVDLVSVYATVIDGTGRLVTDLARDDFEVRDNGRVQPLVVFSSEPQPFSVLVMLDRSGSMAKHFALIRDGAAAFVAEMRPDDRARIGDFSRDVLIRPDAFTSDQAVLTRVLHEDLQSMGPSPVWLAVDRSLTALLPMPDRRVVLLFTDGHDDPERGHPPMTLTDVLRRTRVNGIMVYAIGFVTDVTRMTRATGLPRPWGRGRNPLPVPPVPSPPGSGLNVSTKTQPPDPGLKELAHATGGGYFELDARQDLRATFVRVAEELHRQYWLGFKPRSLDGRVHDIEVRVRRPGLTVRARQQYVATPPGR